MIVIVVGLIPFFQAEERTIQRAVEAAAAHTEDKGLSSFTTTSTEVLPKDSELGEAIIEVKGYADNKKDEEIIIYIDYSKKDKVVKSSLEE